jgi:transcriptional regulator with XRE-family HTH domain
MQMSKDELMYEFGQNLKDAMENADVNACDLAVELEVSEATVSRYINGVRLPDIPTLINICYVLVCDLEDLIDASEMIE